MRVVLFCVYVLRDLSVLLVGFCLLSCIGFVGRGYIICLLFRLFKWLVWVFAWVGSGLIYVLVG